MGLAVTWLEVVLRILPCIRTIRAYGSAQFRCVKPAKSAVPRRTIGRVVCCRFIVAVGRAHIRACKHEHFCRYLVVRGNKMLPDRGYLRHIRHRDGWGFSLFKDHCDRLFMQKCAFRFLCVWLAGPISGAVVCLIYVNRTVGNWIHVQLRWRQRCAHKECIGRTLFFWPQIDMQRLNDCVRFNWIASHQLIGNWQRHSWPQQSYQ